MVLITVIQREGRDVDVASRFTWMITVIRRKGSDVNVAGLHSMESMPIKSALCEAQFTNKIQLYSMKVKWHQQSLAKVPPPPIPPPESSNRCQTNQNTNPHALHGPRHHLCVTNITDGKMKQSFTFSFLRHLFDAENKAQVKAKDIPLKKQG